MLNRQKILLELINYLESKNRNDKLTLIKILFLLKQEVNLRFSFYSFYPYILGPFSLKVYSDLNYFQRIGWLLQNKKIVNLTEQGKTQIKLNPKFIKVFDKLLQKFPDINELLTYVYNSYPQYTVNSRLKTKKSVNKHIDDVKIHLIGYEGKDIDSFLNVLIDYNIKYLIDVRNNPHSMKFDFNKNKLQDSLKKVKIQYIHIPELGIPSEYRKNLKTQSDYEQIFDTYSHQLPFLQSYIDQIISIGQKEKIGIMCFEQNVKMCHRREIGKYLERKGIEVKCIS